MTPRQILHRNATAYVVTQALSLAALVYAIRTGNIGGAMIWAYIVGAVGPLFMVGTYFEARRAWRGEEPNPVTDVSLPAATVGVTFVAAYWLL